MNISAFYGVVKLLEPRFQSAFRVCHANINYLSTPREVIPPNVLVRQCDGINARKLNPLEFLSIIHYFVSANDQGEARSFSASPPPSSNVNLDERPYVSLTG